MFNVLRWFAVLLALSVCACVYVPRTSEVYDAQCQLTLRHSELAPMYIAALGGCRDDECIGLLAFAGAITAASAVVSGSVMLVENVVYWLEERDCVHQVSPNKPK